MTADRQRVAILGGGIAGLTAAFELTRPELGDRYDVTVYQQGWRLGGKCASGRNHASGDRIEEHGLHLWFGAYENAFALMRRCYEELDRPTTAPLARLDDVFEPSNTGILWDELDGRWTPFTMEFPPEPGEPGDGQPVADLWDMARRALTMHRDERRKVRHARQHRPGPIERVVGGAVDVVLTAVLKTVEARARRRSLPGERSHRRLLSTALRVVRRWVWRHEIAPHLDDDRLRQWYTRFDLTVTMMVGTIDDDLVERGFDVVNDTELRDWLRDHGASEVTLSGAMVRAWYCGAFAFLGGDTSRPNVAAGTSVRGMLRQQLGYKGALVWKMRAGMGDAVVAPLYEVLRRRGVRFELFTRVAAVEPSEDGSSIGAIHLVHQLGAAGTGYEPLIDVGGLPCWPSEPKWDQFDEATREAAVGVNFEVEDAPCATRSVLAPGADFDRVVLAISVAALPPLCPKLLADPARPRFAAMIEASATCMTQGLQLWLRRPLAGLGWSHPSAISSTFVEPLDTYSDMSQLIPAERWAPSADVRSIAYFCGVLADEDGDDVTTTHDRVRRSAIQFLGDDVATLWPDFSWDLLVAPDGVVGEARLDDQFWRANFPLTERYVLSPAGSIGSRLAAGESEWRDLVFAGDWTRTGLDLGCVEATVMSGMQAARAISGAPIVVVGESDAWIRRGLV